MSQLPKIQQNIASSNTLYQTQNFGKIQANSRVPYQNPQTQVNSIHNQNYFPGYTQDKMQNRNQIFAANAQKLKNLERTSQISSPQINQFGSQKKPIKERYPGQSGMDNSNSNRQSFWSLHNTNKDIMMPGVLPQIRSPMAGSLTQISSLSPRGKLANGNTTYQNGMDTRKLQKSPIFQQNEIDEETNHTLMRDPLSSLKDTDLRHHINQIKESHGIQSNQFQLRNISNNSSLKKDKSQLKSNQISPRGNVMLNERAGHGHMLEQFNNSSTFPSRQITGPITRNPSSTIQSNQGISRLAQNKGKTFYNGFQQLVTVPESSPAAMKKKANQEYQILSNGNKANYDSFVLQAQGSQKPSVFKNINFKYPENLQAIKISGEDHLKPENPRNRGQKVLKLPDHQFKRVTQVYRSRHKRYLKQIQANKSMPLSKISKSPQKDRTIQVSILESKNLRGTEKKEKTRDVELPELKSFLDLENKILMEKLTKQFIKDCGEKLGVERIKHMFAMVPMVDRENARYMEPSQDSQAIIFRSQPSYSELVPEELMDISEIFKRELEHIYVAKFPLLRMKQRKDSKPANVLSIGLGTGMNIDSIQKLPLGPRPGGLDRSESETHTLEQASLSPITNQNVANYIQFVRSEERKVHKIKFINSIQAFEKEEQMKEAQNQSHLKLDLRQDLKQPGQELSTINEQSYKKIGGDNGVASHLVSVEDQDSLERSELFSHGDVKQNATPGTKTATEQKKIRGMKTEQSSKLRWVEAPDAGLDNPISQTSEFTRSKAKKTEEDKALQLSKHEIIHESIKNVTSKISLGLEKQNMSKISLKNLHQTISKVKFVKPDPKPTLIIPETPNLFLEYNKAGGGLPEPTAPVDIKYENLPEFANLRAVEKTTPFNRQQLYDFYTKFKALSKFCKQNDNTLRNKHIKKLRIAKTGRRIQKEKDPVTIAGMRPNTPPTPTMGRAEKIASFKNQIKYVHKEKDRIGVDRHTFKQGLQECRRYNQSILDKIFMSLDSGGKGYLTWDEFHEGMKIVCSDNEEDKVDLFLRMVDGGGGDDDDDDDEDEGGNGTFDLDEITIICLLTFEKEPRDEDEKNSDEEPDILEETADFQARSIFSLLGYEVDDEIPIEVFKHHVFHGNEETRIALRQFCCLD